MLSIGACNVYEPDSAFSCLIRPISPKVVPEAIEVTGLSIENLYRDGLPPEIAMENFATWIKTIRGSKMPVFVGLNAPFDWSFINYYFIRYLGSNPFGFTALDIKAYYMGAKKCTWRETRSSNIKSATGATSAANHEALQDARHQAELFRLLKDS